MVIVLACDVPLAQNNGTAVAGTNLKNALEAIRGGLVPVVSDSRRSATRFLPSGRKMPSAAEAFGVWRRG